MRGTVAKKLRRMAERATVGMPARAYQAITYRGREGAQVFERFALHPDCTRAVYRRAKNAYKRPVVRA